MKTQIFPTYADFLKREDKAVNGVSPEFAKNHPDYEKQNETNQACWDCKACEACKACGRCVGRCPKGAISIRYDEEDALFERLMARVDGVADIRRRGHV